MSLTKGQLLWIEEINVPSSTFEFTLFCSKVTTQHSSQPNLSYSFVILTYKQQKPSGWLTTGGLFLRFCFSG